ncbi:hypothetical protein CN97_18705 [Haematobacter massiliensis]|uniref:HTH tetR-type domain-containing protein n=2 Tax=Haematobacter massiliensis TaxID=195105 RepID=A0A086Y2C9_9RHOB|nr:hypothetical protein CN97_18705 [Haematobacter massiliensis]
MGVSQRLPKRLDLAGDILLQIGTPVMKPSLERRSRRESQEATRTRLLEAALQIISSGGVAAASIRGICQRAGFTQGAFYSNFESIDDLLLALVDRHIQTLARELHASLDETRDLPLDSAMQRMAAHLSRLARDPTLSLMLVELHLHARRNPAFAVAFEPVRRRHRAEFAGVAAAIFDAHGLQPQIGADHLASVLMSLWSGVILHHPPQDSLSAEEHMLLVFKALT